MRSGIEIQEVFAKDHFTVLSKLLAWTYRDLEELKSRYIIDYKLSGSMYVKRRIDLINEALIIKRGNEEQAWDYLT